MPAIAKTNDLITVIIIFVVEPEQQQELIDTIIEFIDNAVKYQPGFVSASLHKSLDGIRVMNYAQWQSLEEYYTFLDNSEVQAQGKKLANFNPPDLHIFEVIVSQPENAPLEINQGDLIHLAEFRVKPENQQRLVELEKEYIGVALQNPGLISANFHRSLDGTRTMNYGQWRSLEDFELLLQDPKYKPLSEYWQGLAENEFHLYEVVFTKSTTN
ncbi:antibiotic biosynthesis monooxygenase [Gloeocapsopsis crepidinum LEGE 06123]|uniref:Antibiotic biosynthesis monooxygenase n=1 Tax=Gloeocapsopsis crepidinum LEGE 06123 TaxID=588587 RepID=A0ABR9ULQ3_9CHRO|nr:antibiotic biosynthesis monooxygenase [Gloeocapsopsis crepidinum]MBE9189216.1 antibiotic biosynthesis monooxygenase [Gloeocapsopsis crepidinum LEGE 06123]